jgi:hypothetical protein
MPAIDPHRTPEEVTRLGMELYERDIRPKLQPDDDHKFIAVHIETGDYEIDEDDFTAAMRLRKRHSSGDAWLGCIGEPATYKMRRGR